VLEFKITYLKVKLETTQLQTLKFLFRDLEVCKLSMETTRVLASVLVPRKMLEWSKVVPYTAALLLMPSQRVLKDPGVESILVNF